MKLQSNKLCCVVNTTVTCKHCGETFCADHGRPRNGINKAADEFAEPHWVINQCRKRYTKEQLKDIAACWEAYKAGDEAFLRYAKNKKRIVQGIRNPRRVASKADAAAIKLRCIACRAHFKGRNDRRWNEKPVFTV